MEQDVCLSENIGSYFISCEIYYKRNWYNYQLKSCFITEAAFWIEYVKWCLFYNKFLSVVNAFACNLNKVVTGS
jgi:hypothetical protein